MLARVLDSELLAVLRAIKLDQRSSIAAVEGRVFSRAELVKFINKVLMVTAKSAEGNREFSLLLLEVHQSPVEGRDNVVVARAEDGSVHLPLVTLCFVLSFLLHVELLILAQFVLTSLFLHLFALVIVDEALFSTDAELFPGSLGKGEHFVKLVKMDLELLARTSLFGKSSSEFLLLGFVTSEGFG